MNRKFYEIYEDIFVVLIPDTNYCRVEENRVTG